MLRVLFHVGFHLCGLVLSGVFPECRAGAPPPANSPAANNKPPPPHFGQATRVQAMKIDAVAEILLTFRLARIALCVRVCCAYATARQPSIFIKILNHGFSMGRNGNKWAIDDRDVTAHVVHSFNDEKRYNSQYRNIIWIDWHQFELKFFIIFFL